MNRTWTRAARGRGEQGAYAVMYALLTTVLVGVASVVVDLAALRLDRRVDRAAADAAAIAGAGQLGELGENAVGACRRAIQYADQTLDAGFSAGSCTSFPSTCDPTKAKTVRTSAGGRTLTITWPVPEGDALLDVADVEGSAVAGASGALEAIDTDTDGDPCQRLGVQIDHTHAFSFAGVFGVSGASTTSHSLGLALKNSVGDLAVPVVALREDACPPLGESAVELRGGSIQVGVPSGSPGEVAIDADGSTCPVIDVAPGEELQADRVGIFRLGTSAGYSQVNADLLSRGWRVTDRPWRDRYNCTQTDPALCGKPATAATPLNYVDQWTTYASGLVASVGSAPDTPDHSTWTVIDDVECLAPLSSYSSDIYADCDTLTIPATGATAFNGRLVARLDVNVLGTATFGSSVFVGRDLGVASTGDVTALEDLIVRDGLTADGSVAVDGTLDVDGDATVEGSLADLDAGAIVARDHLTVRSSSAINITGSLYTAETFVVEDATSNVTGSVRVRRELHIRGLSTATFHSGVLVADDLDLSGSSTFRSPGPLVVQNDTQDGSDGLLVRHSACLLVSSPLLSTCVDPPGTASADAGGIYVGGELTVQDGASFVAHRTFTYVAARLQAATDGRLHLFSTIDESDCTATGSPGAAPTAACFEDLALWANAGPVSGNDHVLELSADDVIEGAILAPNGDLTVTWAGDLQLNHTQLVAQRLIFVGDGPSSRLTLVPDPDRTTLIPQSAGTLIR